MFLNKKDNLITFIKYLRKHIQDESFENMDALRDRVINLRNRTYVNEEFDLGMNVFKFDDGFKIEITNEELYFVINVLFYEIDLMNQDTEVEIKKENNIWHFNPELAVYSPDGKLMELYTILNHFKDECFKENNKSTNYKKTILSKCAYTLVGIIPTCVYKFDNGLEIELSENNIDTLISILTDEY